jgi:uncharacterized protein (TIGR02145 family)
MKILITIITGLVLAIGSFLSCQKENNEPRATESEVTFAINSSNLKNSSVYNLSNADKIIITIQQSDGSPTKYTLSEIKIQQMNGLFYSQKIVLETGNYQLTEFLILDNTGNTLFAAPKIGSQEAQNVGKPLPIEFSVVKNSTTPVSVEVISTENRKPEDFGLNHFPIVEVKTFDFMIGLTDKESGGILSAKLTVSNGTYNYVQNLETTLNNVVNVKDGLENYTLKVEKNGYTTYIQTYTANSLKLHSNIVGNLPLLVELQKETTVTDIDGNVYKTVKIGTQVWMAENLKTSKYNDGTPIDYPGTDNAAWQDNSSGAYAWYNNDVTNKATYGALYNWYAVNIGLLCPTEWHVPTDYEWTTLENYLIANGYNYDGTITGNKIAKAMAATTNWTESFTVGTIGNADYSEYRNKSGFTGLPGGNRNIYGAFQAIGHSGLWWSSFEYFMIPVCKSLSYMNVILAEGHINKRYGLSVRCLKD